METNLTNDKYKLHDTMEEKHLSFCNFLKNYYDGVKIEVVNVIRQPRHIQGQLLLNTFSTTTSLE